MWSREPTRPRVLAARRTPALPCCADAPSPLDRSRRLAGAARGDPGRRGRPQRAHADAQALGQDPEEVDRSDDHDHPHPGPTAAGQTALRVTKIVFALPSGTKFNTAAATRCSVAALQASGAAGCKSGSAIGGGTAAALTGTPFDPLRQQVAVYATTTGLAAILTGLQTAVLPLKVKDNKITAVLPRICRPPGTAANGCATGDIVLKELDIKLDAKTKGTGSKAKRLITTPATCVGGKWRSQRDLHVLQRRHRGAPSSTTCRRR